MERGDKNENTSHIANGKEVESVAGKVINVSEFPMLSSVFRSVNQRIQEQATENEEKGA